MERYWLSGYSTSMILLGCLSVLFMLSCTRRDTYLLFSARLDETGHFRLVNTYTVSEDGFLQGINSLAVDKRGNYYFSLLFYRSIIKTKPPFRGYKTIGERGPGPGEYSTPYYVYIYDNQLFWSDINNSFIKSISLDNPWMEDAITIGVRTGACKFVVDGQYIYVLNKVNPLLSVYSRSTGELVKDLLYVDNIFDVANRNLNGGGIALGSDKYLYVAGAVPYVISVFDSNLTLMYQWDLTSLPEIVSWDNNKVQKYRSAGSSQKRIQILHSVTHVRDIHFLQNSSGKALLVRLSGPEYPIFYHLISSSGEIIERYHFDRRNIIGVHDDTVLCVRFKDEIDKLDQQRSIIEEYEFRK